MMSPNRPCPHPSVWSHLGHFCLILLIIHILPCSQAASQPDDDDLNTNLQLVRAGGDLSITERADTPTYVAYFHVPIANADQVPLWFEVSSYNLIDYRFVQTTGNNILVAARMRSAAFADLTWRSWVMVDDNRFTDLPHNLPMSSLADLPDSVLPWLQPTDTAQVDATIVQEKAQNLLSKTTRLVAMATNICSFSHSLPWEIPGSFDAYSALMWGSSCTGRAHTATALCRALGIPARTKLALPRCSNGGYLDMHWSTDYHVPGYGWVPMDPSQNLNPIPTHDEVVIYCCDPADEFPLFYTNGIDCFWHTSNPELGIRNPTWGASHFSDNYTYTLGLTEQTDLALALARSAFNFHTAYQGIVLDSSQQAAFDAGCAQHAAALDCLRQGDLAGAIGSLESAVANYQTIDVGPSRTCFATDFEGDAAGWSHGGAQDEWELGAPSLPGPQTSHSGLRCWGMDLDGTYESPADAWLLSPAIDLTDHISAFLEFWVWNQVYGAEFAPIIYDPLWLDITTDGTTFTPLCSMMGGGNDDPEIPRVGGWAQMNLDLTPYVGNTVQIRFRFQSKAPLPQAGPYIDDVRVYGRKAVSGTGVGESPGAANPVLTGLSAAPNPFNPLTRISFKLGSAQGVKAAIYDLQGREVMLLANRFFAAGPQNLVWEGKDEAGRAVPSGTYLLRVTAGESSLIEKLVLVR